MRGRRIVAVVTALIAMVIWLFVTLGVAMPDKILLVFVLRIQDISDAFIRGEHYEFVPLLLGVDILISVVILNDAQIKSRIMNRPALGLLILLLSSVCFLGFAERDYGLALTPYNRSVFVVLLCLYGLLRAITYVGETGTRSNAATLREAPATGAAPASVGEPQSSGEPIRQTLTAIPVRSLKEQDEK